MNKFHFTIVLIMLVLSGCSTRGKNVYHNTQNIAEDTAQSISYKPHTSKNAYVHPTMKSYVVRGVRYHPTMVKVGDVFEGNASWYGPDFHGKVTSNGEKYNMWGMTAAHKTFPMNTIVKVTNLRNHLTTVVRINDRGPFVSTRIIDLSKAAASKVNMIGHGTAPIRLEILGFKGKKQKIVKKQKKSGNYALQIASFSNIEGALKVQAKYDNISGYKTVISDIDSENGRVFKVLLKGFKSEEEAREYKDNSVFENAFIVRED